MKVYTYSEARQRLAELLDEAREGGEIRIRRRDGTEYVLKSVRATASPLDVPGIHASVSRDEIVEVVREIRARPATGRAG